MDGNNQEPLSKLTPPDRVKGMTQLNRDAFTGVFKIPTLRIPKSEIRKTQKVWKPLLFKAPGVKPIVETNDCKPEKGECLILLDPDKLQADNLSEHQKAEFQNLGLDINNPDTFQVELHYDNWALSDIMKAVLPSDHDTVSSYTQVGHIAHLNLKEVTLPYKHLIGEVIMDKIRTVKTVVNKLTAIDSTYRNFQMELLAGEENYITQIKEHGCVYELDFSKVYWNSRLSTEHQRIVDLVEKDSIVYDVFAGIGPFTVPLAKKKRCTVFANDLNPSSFEYLKKNIELNKLTDRTIQTFNMDGRDFIKSVVKSSIIDRVLKSVRTEVSKMSSLETKGMSSDTVGADKPAALQLQVNQGEETENTTACHSYVIMNLPALAVEFLDSFISILDDLPSELKEPQVLEPYLPHVFCYTFTPKNFTAEDIQTRVEKIIGQPMPESLDVRIVRNVAPNKEMICLSFQLWPALVFHSSEDRKILKEEEEDSEFCKEPDSKRQKL